MKTKVLFLGALFVAQIAVAKDHALVVRGKGLTQKGHTEVFVHDNEDSDTITVTPGDGVTTVTVTVSDLAGNLLGQQILTSGDHIDFSTDDDGPGVCLEVRDDRGYTYKELN